MSSKRLSHDQKRKKKVAQRQKANSPAVTPYEGRKYREDQFAPILYRAECGIREADEMSDNRLTDRDVRKSLEAFVLHLRGDTPQASLPDLVANRIQAHWKLAAEKQVTRPANADLSGVLRTIIASLDTRTVMTPGGRGYLGFLIGFLGKVGFNVKRIAPDTLVVPIDEADEEDEEDE